MQLKIDALGIAICDANTANTGICASACPVVWALHSALQRSKAEKIKRKIYPTRNEARAEIFNYIEFFYNRKRHHGNNDGLSPIEYEQRYFEELSVV